MAKKKEPKKKGDDKKKKDDGKKKPQSLIPPLGTFDPALEAQRHASRRGLEDLIQDIQSSEGHAREDLTTQLANYLRQFQRGGEDLDTTLQRGIRDLGLSRTRGIEDFTLQGEAVERARGRGISDLTLAGARAGEDFDYAGRKLGREYGMLGSRQAQQINATHQIRGGALAASAAKRAGNQAFEFEPIQRTHSRQLQDITTKQGRLNEDADLGLADIARQQNRFLADNDTAGSDLTTDVGTSRTRLGEDYSTQTNLAQRGYSRGVGERQTQLSRGTREQALLEQDLTAQEFFDASQRNPELEFPSSAYSPGGATTGKPKKPKKPKKGK